MQNADPEKLEMAAIVTKNSKTGITSNKRLLVIKKGYLYYYSVIPKAFRGDLKMLQNFHELPKCSIQILNIKKVKGYEDKSSYFSIQFEAKHMMEREDIRKTMTLQQFNFAPKNTTETITWQFTCENQFVKRKWVNALQNLHLHYSKQKNSIRKYFDNIHNQEEQTNLSMPIRSSTRVPWKEEKMKSCSSDENLVQRTSYVNEMMKNKPLKNEKMNPDKKKKSPQDIVKKFIELDEENKKQEQLAQKSSDKSYEDSAESKSRSQNGLSSSQSKSRSQNGLSSSQRSEGDQELSKQKSAKNQINYTTSQIIQADSIVELDASLTSPSYIGNEGSQNPNFEFMEETVPKISYNTKGDKLMKPQQTTLRTKNKLQSQILIDDELKFDDLQEIAFSRQLSFHKRHEAQKRLNLIIGNFVEKANCEFVDFVNSKLTTQHSRYKQQKKGDGLSYLQIGYINYRIGYVETQAITINNKKRVFYNQESIKRLKKQMKLYNRILNIIVEGSKTKSQGSHNSSLRLRVPLCAYIEYRGIVCIAFDDSFSDSQLEEITDRKLIARLGSWCKAHGFSPSGLTFKKCQSANGESILVQVSNIKNAYDVSQQAKKHHNVSFEPPIHSQFLKRAKKDNASTSSESLLKYIKGIRYMQNSTIFTCPKSEIIVALEYCYLCKTLRKFYRAGQGELDEKNLINLLLKGDENITKLFEGSGFEMELSPKDCNKRILGIFFEFLEYYLGITCYYKSEQVMRNGHLVPLGIYGTQSKNLVEQIKLKSRVIGYNLENIELYQSFSKIDRYLSNQQTQIAAKALEIKEAVFDDYPYQERTYPQSTVLEQIRNSAELNLIENDYISTINRTRQYIDLCSLEYDEHQYQITQAHVIPIYFLMMKCYSKFSIEKFNSALQEATKLVIFNYGEQSYYLITLFMFAGVTLAGMNNKQKSVQFLQMAIRIHEQGFEGISQVKLSQLYLEYSRVLASTNQQQESSLFLAKSKQIASREGSYTLRLFIIKYQLDLMLLSEFSVQNSEKTLSLLSELESLIQIDKTQPQVLRQLYRRQFELGNKIKMREVCEKALSKLWESDASSQTLALELCYRMIVSDNYTRLEGINGEYDRIVCQHTLSKQKCLLELTNLRAHYKDLIEMVEQILLEEDQKFLAILFSLIPAHVVKSYEQFHHQAAIG